MPRNPRTFSSSGIYHIILRSVNQHIIFEDDSDYKTFLTYLSDGTEKYDIDIYAYCLMDNHVHLLLYSDPSNLSLFFQSLGTRFARWYNTKYERCGHLFQNRYHSIIIEDQPHFLSTLLYIHNNPVKANICQHPYDYRWSSYNTYYSEKDRLVNVSFAYNLVGTKADLLDYFDLSKDEFVVCEDELLLEEHLPRQFMSDERALDIFKTVTQLSSTSETSHLSKELRNKYIRALKEKGLTIKQLMRVMDISAATVKRICKMSQ